MLEQLGGVASRRQLLEHLTPAQLRAAVEERVFVRIAHGLYARPEVAEAEVSARALSGVLSHTSAALHHGWAVKTPPMLPHVTVPRHRKVSGVRRKGVDLHYRDVRSDGVATTPEQTVVDCARDLPFDEALSVVDSALRSGVGRATLLRAAERSPRTGRPRVVRVVGAGDARADNPFESVVRAIAWEFPSLRLEPQVTIAGYGRPDLYDESLGLIVECDSFSFHSERAAVVKDVERYNAAEIHGLGLLRFAWEHAMLRQDYVRDTLREWLAVKELTGRLAVGRRCPSCAA